MARKRINTIEYSCDRCKAEIPTWNDMYVITVNPEVGHSYRVVKDLCRPCFLLFQKFIHNEA